VLTLFLADVAATAGFLAVLATTADNVLVMAKVKNVGVWELFSGPLWGVLWSVLLGVLVWRGLAAPLAVGRLVGLLVLVALVLGGVLRGAFPLLAALLPPVLGMVGVSVRPGVASLLVLGPLLGLVLRRLGVTLVPPRPLLEEGD